MEIPVLIQSLMSRALSLTSHLLGSDVTIARVIDKIEGWQFGKKMHAILAAYIKLTIASYYP